MKKFLGFIFFLIFLFSLYLYRIDLKQTSLYQSLPNEVRSVIRVIVSNKLNTYRLNNDYNIKFLPETQNFNLEFNKFKINTHDKDSDIHESFFIDLHDNNLFLTFKSANKNSDIFYIKITDLLNLNLSNNRSIFKKISHNLKNIYILDSLIYKNSIYLSVSQKGDQNCRFFAIYKSDLNLEKLFFQKIFFDKTCYGTIQAGKMQYHKSYGNLLVSTAADIMVNLDRSDLKPQDDNSLMGKVLLINENNGNYKIISKGHRNILGLYVDDAGLILSTENGPRGGDEVNLIKEGFNYGWPVSSYGEKDDYKKYDQNEKPFYKKSHIEYNFQEPIFSFVPSIGISEIIKVGNNFSEFWKDSFLITSLNDQHIYRMNFDKEYQKVKYYERIFIGERIRDIKFYDKENIIFLALEESGSIGILKKK